jgi:creatinine amidohydrolase
VQPKRLQHMTWEEFKAEVEQDQVVILPFGSVEQHGQHLPLGSDSLVAIALAEAASERTGAVVAPPLWFGWSPHHMVLPGTITVRPEVLIEVAYDIVESLARHGCKKFLMINGHRLVNIAWLQIAAERLKRNLDVKIALFDPGYMHKEIVGELGFGRIAHAEEIESSHMWHCYPELYHEDRVRDFVHEPTPLYNVDPSYPGDTLCYIPSSPKEMAESVERAGGTSGRPSQASPAKGKRYHEYLVERLVQVIEMMRSH